MSALGRGRGTWKKPEQVKFFPVAVGSFADRGSDAIDNAAKKFLQDSEFILNSGCLEDCIIELVRQHPGGLLLEHFPSEFQRIYGKPIPPEWSSVVEKCPDLTEDNAPGVGLKILYNSTFANFINQETENTWILEVVEVNSTADISVKTDVDVVEKCSLCALEDLHADVELTVFLKEVLCERVFTCHLVSLENPPSVVLYDGSNNMNLRFAEQTALQAAPIQLKEGMSSSVRVTYIPDKMSVCVRPVEEYFELLKHSLNMVMRLKSETRRKRFVVCKKDLKKLCALQINSNWYRVSVKSQESPTEVTVNLVDVGSSISVDPFSLIVLDSISTVFSNVPPQAVEVVLDPLHNSPHVHDLLLGAKNQRSYLVMKVLKSDKSHPSVVVFRDPADKMSFSSSSPKLIGNSASHQQGSGCVYSLNSSMLSLSVNSVVNEEKPKSSLEDAVPYDSDSDLKYWKSLAGNRFKVYVFSAKSPLDIMLQLSKNRPGLEMLMEMIQEHYESQSYILDDPGELQQKTVYAALVKNWWYRVKIVRMCGEDVWVHLLDYGTSVSVQPEQIRKLPKEFGEEVVPFQALRAEIKGARECISANQEAVKDLEDILLENTFTCKVWRVESDYICPARIEVDLYDDAGNSVLNILYPAAASPC